MASYTVNFEDGTSHVYDNVPDDIDQQNVQDRASMEFSDKRVVGASKGAGAPEEQKQEPGIGTKIAGAAQTAVGIGKDIVTSPLGEMALGGYGAKKFALDPLLEALKTRGAVPAPVNPGIQVPPNTGGVPRQFPSQAAQQTFNALKAPAPAISAGAPAAETVATQTPGVMQRGMDMASKMRQIAAQRVIAPAAAMAAPAAVPAAVGAGGAGLTAYAANLLSKLSPEQRKQLMGDVGSDTGFAAAIMNRGQ
jgi:hypothetical protein